MNQLLIVQEEEEEARRRKNSKKNLVGSLDTSYSASFIYHTCLLISNLYRVMNHLKTFYDTASFSVRTF